jgi:hypothetical protein
MARASAVPASASTPVAIPLREVLPWLIYAGAVLPSLVSLVGLDQGATAIAPGDVLHEFVHDGRHILGAGAGG